MEEFGKTVARIRDRGLGRGQGKGGEGPSSLVASSSRSCSTVYGQSDVDIVPEQKED